MSIVTLERGVASRCYCMGVAAHIVMQLVLLTVLSVVSEAMAQDAQCVPERAAMVDTIRAYARLEADVLGPQGISERVLDAVGQTERHRFIPAVLFGRIHARAGAHWPRPNHIAAVYS